MDIIIKIIQFFLCFTILVGIHELGHFLMARVFKIRVDKFYIFFDPWFSLFKFKRGDTEYGLGTDLLAEGHQLNKAELLFEKIEDETIQAQVDKLLATKKENEAASYKANPIKPTISFEEFEKLDIRVGTVLECETVPKMKKLLKFKIADGLENRTIVSGIAQHYAPEELVGKQVLFIANLAPRQFKNGLVSEGMILSAENFDGSLAVTSLLKEVKPGSEVK